MIFADLGGKGVGALNSADFPTATVLNMNVGTEMSAAFYSWVRDSVKRGMPASGSVVSTDYSRKVLYWDDWDRGQVSQIVFPAADAGSSAALTLNLSIQFRSVKERSDAPGKYDGYVGPRGKSLLAKNFMLSINGVPDCNHVITVDSMTVGGAGCGKFSIPDLTVTLVERWAAGFRSWQQSGTRKSGTFQYLAPNMKRVFELSFGELAVASIAPVVPLNPAATVTVKLRSSTFDFAYWAV